MKLENRTFISLLIIFTLAFIWIMTPFFGAVLWAVAISIIFFPLKVYLEKVFRGRNVLASLVTLLTCCFLVIIPAVIIFSLIVDQSQSIAESLKSDDIKPAEYLDKVEGALPRLSEYTKKLGISVDDVKVKMSEMAGSFAEVVSKNSLVFGKSAIGFMLDVGIMLYLSFFLLKDGKLITSKLLSALPIGEDREKLIFSKFKRVTRATVKGNIVVACVQGAIGGITFGFIGIPGSALWAFVMTIASMIPAVGAAIIWGPVALYLALTGSYMEASILIFVGVVIISLIDNFLRPILVGRDTKMPDYIIFMSTIGGIAMFGVNGFIIGPMIAAMFYVFWSIFIDDFQ